MALSPPTNVVASLFSVGASTVTYAIDWVIREGRHPGPYTVTVDYSAGGAAYANLGVYTSNGDAQKNTTHPGAANGTTYQYRVKWFCDDCGQTSAYGYSNVIVRYTETDTDTITLSDEVTQDAVYSGSVVDELITMSDHVLQTITDDIADTITMSDAVLSSSTLKTDYAYYLGDENGDIYTYSFAYGGFNGAAMESYIKFKKTDFSEVAPQAEGHANTAYRAKLTYVDKGQQFVTFYWSTDGAVTWQSSGKTIGTSAAPGVTKTAFFDFISSGEFFNWKIGCSSTSGTFQWVGLDIEFVIGGEVYA